MLTAADPDELRNAANALIDWCLEQKPSRERTYFVGALTSMRIQIDRDAETAPDSGYVRPPNSDL